MKKTIQILVLLIIPFSGMSQTGIYPGMHIDHFRMLMPKRIPVQLRYNETLYLNDTINGVNGKWTFKFRNNKLNTAGFQSEKYYLSYNKNVEEDKNTIAQSRYYADEVVRFYEKKYGQPVTKEENKLTVNPDKANYSKELFVKYWELNDMTIVVKYMFEGDNPQHVAVKNAEVSLYAYVIRVGIKPPENGQKKHQEKFYIDMHIQDFADNFPELLPYGVTENGQSNYRDSYYGLGGYWHYLFKNDTLQSYGYTFNQNRKNELNKENFEQCLSAAKKIIEEYTGYYGEPDSLYKGKQIFVDPNVNRHYGYDVIEARWIEEDQLIKVSFDFFGGKGQYFFQVNADFYKPDYEYF